MGSNQHIDLQAAVVWQAQDRAREAVIRDPLAPLAPLTGGTRVTPETLAAEEALAQVPLEKRSAVISGAIDRSNASGSSG